MSTRKFTDWNNCTGDIHNGILIMKQMLIDIDTMMEDYELTPEKIEYLKKCKEEIAAIYSKYEGKGYSLSSKINEEIHSPEVINYLYEHNKYPENPSKTFMEVTADFEVCFDIEQQIHDDIVVPIWEEYLTSGEKDLELGEDFAYVIHSGMGFIILPNMPGYRDNIYNNTSYISSSLLTSKHMSMYNNQVGLIMKVNKDNLLAASAIDCVARTENSLSVNNVRHHEGGYISVGYSHGIGNGDIVTKILTPKAIERESIKQAVERDGEILNYSGGKIINEIDIFKPAVEVDGVFLKSNGCDILLNEYLAAKQMEQAYGKKLRIINQSVYRKKEGLTPCTKEDIDVFKQMIAYYQDEKNYDFIKRDPEFISELLDMYWAEVVEPNGYEEQVKSQIRDTFDKMQEYSKKVIKQRDTGTLGESDGQEPFDD